MASSDYNLVNLDLIDSLSNVLEERISSWYGAGALIQKKYTKLIIYPYSFFISFRIQTIGNVQTLLAKIHRKPHISSVLDAIKNDQLVKAARDEYEITKVIWQTFRGENSPDFTAVEPLGYFDGWNAILMKKVEGRPLKYYIMHPLTIIRNKKYVDAMERYLAAAVTWLKIFHKKVGGENNQLFPADDAMGMMDEIISKLHNNSKGQVMAGHYRSKLTGILGSISKHFVPIALLHDDFQYSNILVENTGRVCVIDYALNHVGCTYADLATLLVDPQTRFFQVLSNGKFLSKNTINLFRKTILEIYFQDIPYNRRVLDFYCALAILNKWSADESDIKRSKLYPRSLILFQIRNYYAEILKEYL